MCRIQAPRQLSGIEGTKEGVTEIRVVRPLIGRGMAAGEWHTAQRWIDTPGELFVVVFSQEKKGWEAVHGIKIGTSAVRLAYIQRLMEIRNAATSERAKFFAESLNSPDEEIRADAIGELGRLNRQERAAALQGVDPDRFASLALDAKIDPATRTAAFMCLSRTGNEKHVPIFRKAINDGNLNHTSLRQEAWYGYLLLSPREGLSAAAKKLRTPNVEFIERYCAYLAVRDLTEDRPDLARKNDAAAVMLIVLENPDTADFGVETLRKWRRFELTPEVLATKPEPPVTRRAILRFAIESPHPAAVQYAAQERRRDREYFEDAIQYLKLEADEAAKLGKGNP